ncbi:hypothetical protein K7X08_016284 [Anisodus acutangulus]|uniref:Uncharacterized protein n=1 Tax=Anisodus acutangulus TaxID=402998 RepID=A0A9Q1QZW6_9SOLA|nr:hypothetical protein K7X08_016284 [Anisodus acutangulus]
MLRKSMIMSTSVIFKLVSRNRYGLLSISVLFTSINFDPVNALDGSPLSHPDYIDDAHDGPSSTLPDQVADTSARLFLRLILPMSTMMMALLVLCMIKMMMLIARLFLMRLLTLLLIVKIDRPNGRITDVLTYIHGEDDIEEFVDAAQNGYEIVNEEVV